MSVKFIKHFFFVTGEEANKLECLSLVQLLLVMVGSSLFGLVNSDEEKVCNNAVTKGQCYKTFYVHKLTNFCNKLEYLSLASFSSLFQLV